VRKENRNVPDLLAASLAGLIPGYPHARLCVAVSGGLDSVALLHAARAAVSGEPGVSLRAIHVDHGLQAQSKEWTAVCRSQCEALHIPLQVIELHLEVPQGASVEAEARRARYAAIADAMLPGEYLLTAHHADDQLETVLLQLFRGAGVQGLAAMPALATLGPGWHVRPLLSVERSLLEAYATATGLSWVDDPMNRESRYDRSYLRHEVLPAIRARWPAVAITVGRSAVHFATAQELLEALAEVDGAALVDGKGRLEIAGLVLLPRDRQANVLRWWIVGSGLGLPSTARLASILRDVVPVRDDAQPVVTWPTGEVRRYRGRLYAMPPGLDLTPEGDYTLEPGRPLAIAGVGLLEIVEVQGAGISASRFPGPFSVRFRQGGERLRPAGRALEKPLQQWLQEAGVEPWRRGRLPLVYSGGHLLAVAGLWVSDEAATPCDEIGRVLRWTESGQVP
jgi:tRNA(Ile)-lysidine synthase